MAIDLVPLCTAEVWLATPIPLIGTPEGNLLIYEVEKIEIEGDRIRARMAGKASADWMQLSQEMVGTLDVRVTLESHDGALIYGTYRGRANLIDSDSTRSAVVYAAPLFSTGDSRYGWLNRIQVIAKGLVSPDGRRLSYEMYEVR